MMMSLAKTVRVSTICTRRAVKMLYIGIVMREFTHTTPRACIPSGSVQMTTSTAFTTSPLLGFLLRSVPGVV